MYNIFNDTLIIGDSNLARIETKDMPADTQIEAFPGANISHITSILKKYPNDKPKPKRIILSVGINNRDSDLTKTKQDCKELFECAAKKFPKSEIAFCEINFSGRLKQKSRENLTAINKLAASTKEITNIPAIEKSHFKLTRDNIHWKPETAKYMVNWWSQNLNY